MTGHAASERDDERHEPLSAAERARRYRQRKKESGGAGPARGYRWEDAKPGNLLALQHGANSPRFVDPLAAQIVADTLAGPDCPAHLKLARYQPALAAWARSEACCLLVAEWLGTMDVVTALTATSSSRETEDRNGGSVTRTGSVRHVEGAMSALDRHQRTAARLRDALGLTPVSAARIKEDTKPRKDVMVLMKERIEELDREAADGR